MMNTLIRVKTTQQKYFSFFLYGKKYSSFILPKKDKQIKIK